MRRHGRGDIEDERRSFTLVVNLSAQRKQQALSPLLTRLPKHFNIRPKVFPNKISLRYMLKRRNITFLKRYLHTLMPQK